MGFRVLGFKVFFFARVPYGFMVVQVLCSKMGGCLVSKPRVEFLAPRAALS